MDVVTTLALVHTLTQPLVYSVNYSDLLKNGTQRCVDEVNEVIRYNHTHISNICFSVLYADTRATHKETWGEWSVVVLSNAILIQKKHSPVTYIGGTSTGLNHTISARIDKVYNKVTVTNRGSLKPLVFDLTITGNVTPD